MESTTNAVQPRSNARSVAGTWYNQHGSELRLEVDAKGRLKGEFRRTGHSVIEAGELRIRACWHMSVQVPAKHPELELWKGTWTGEDEFRREPFGVREWTGGSQPLPEWP